MYKELFLDAVGASLTNTTIEWKEPVSTDDWAAFFKLASDQNVLSLVYQSIYRSKAFQESGSMFAARMKGPIQKQVVQQIMQTEEFLELYRKLSAKGLQPIVVKGIICRNLYPCPDNRISGDEDLYIPSGMYEEYHAALAEADMEVARWDAEKIDILHEISYVKKKGVLRIELHKDLFDAGSDAYAGMNDHFAHAFERSVIVPVNGVEVRTMCPTDHLLFLIYHAFKHFIASGFGIRQVCDMVMFANTYGQEIDWQQVLEQCRKIKCDVFAAALFDIGAKYLNFDPEQACYPEAWKQITPDSQDLLDDLLDAGVFGASDMSRKHSSTITINAVSSQNQGKKARFSLMKTVFPPAADLAGRYPYLKKYPFLLPIAWGDRILHYKKESAANKEKNNAADSIRIGSQRVELLRKYKIL